MIFSTFFFFNPTTHINSPWLNYPNRLQHIRRCQTPRQHNWVVPGDAGCQRPIGDLAGAAVEGRVVGVEEEGRKAGR